MPTDDKTIDLPLDGSLSQKTQAEWLAPGSATTAQNLLRQKTGASTKRFGLRALSKTTVSLPIQGNPGVSITLSAGKRLGTFRQNLFAVSKDSWTDAVFVYDEPSATNVMLDRTPEVYLQPYEFLAGSNGVVSSIDTAIVGSYEVHAWVDPAATSSCQLLTMVRDLTSGEVIQPPIPIVFAGFAGADKPHLVVCGSTAVLAFATPSADWNIYGCTMVPGPGATWSTPVRLNTNASDAVNLVFSQPAPFDVAATIGLTNEIVLLYEQKTGAGTAALRMTKFSVPSLASTTTTTIDGSDATWTADYGGNANNAALTGVCIRSDQTTNEVGYVYCWKNGGGTLRVSTGIRLQSTLANSVTPVNIGTASIGINSPLSVTIERIGTIGGVTSCYKIRASQGSPNWNAGASLTAHIISWIVGNNAGTMAQQGSARDTFGVALWSRDVVVNGIGYLVGYVPSSTQGSFFLFADDAWSDSGSTNSSIYGTVEYPLRLVGNIAPRLSNLLNATNIPSFGNPQCNPHVPISGSVAQTVVSVSQTAQNSLPTLISFDFASPLLHQSGELGQNAVLSNGSPSGFDGSQVFELAFPTYPVIQGVTFNPASGSLGTGAYLWIATFEWTDARGQIHRSGRSVPVGGTAPGSGYSATIVVGVCGFSAKEKAANAASPGVGLGGSPQGWFPPRRQVTIKLWRTQSGGTIYNFVAQTTNVLGNISVSFTDSATDAAIQSQPLLYGDGSNGTDPGSILDNLCPPASQAMVVHKQRAFLVDGPRVWVSKAFTSGEGAGFNEATAFSVDDGPGNLTALASLDDKLVLFKRDRMFYMTGEGPADNGTNNDFTPPQRIASDVGCIDWRSVLSTAQGVYFMSPAGRRLLTRDLQVQPVPVVEDVDAALPAVTGGVIHPSEGRLLWSQNANDTSTPRFGSLVSDNYILDAWTTAQVKNQGAATIGMVSVAVSNVLVSGAPVPTFHGLAADGTVWRQKTTSDSFPYEDFDGAVQNFVPSLWVSPWLKSDGLQGWSCWRAIRLFLQQLDAADITIKVAYDYNPAPVDIKTFTAASYASYSPPQVLVQPTRQRAESMQITITDASSGTGTTGQGYRLLGVRVDYAVEPGGYRLPVAQQG